MTTHYVSGSQNTCGPGIYLVLTPNITITLETWTHWPDASKIIKIKDQTNTANPGITVKAPNISGAAIDFATSLVLVNQGESLTFTPTINGNSYALT